LYYAHVASMFVDVEWDEDIVMTYRQRLDKIMGTVEELVASESDMPAEEIDSWLLSRFNTHIGNIRKSMEKYDLRGMATTTYYEMMNDFKWYNRRGGNNKDTITEALRIWITCMMPITPHVAEELWEKAGFDGMVSAAQLPESGNVSASSEYGEELIKSVMSDIAQIKKVSGIDAGQIVLYTAPAWKVEIMKYALEMKKAGNLEIPSLTKKCMANEELRKNGKAVSEFAKKTAVDFQRTAVDNIIPMVELDETKLLKSCEKFLEEEIGTPVKVYNADEEGIYDPKGKSKVAIPGRPALYLE
jgi:leucyl-tRNA synthetase